MVEEIYDEKQEKLIECKVMEIDGKHYIEFPWEEIECYVDSPQVDHPPVIMLCNIYRHDGDSFGVFYHDSNPDETLKSSKNSNKRDV
jgi:hypothetical protein